jgi:hypothetical protein
MMTDMYSQAIQTTKLSIEHTIPFSENQNSDVFLIVLLMVPVTTTKIKNSQFNIRLVYRDRGVYHLFRKVGVVWVFAWPD